MVCFHITIYESREVQGITLQNIWDKTYKHWQILIKTAGIFLWSGPATADRVNSTDGVQGEEEEQAVALRLCSFDLNGHRHPEAGAPGAK